MLPLTYKESQCFLNAYINKMNHYKDKNLKFVLGSLGIGGFFEYGGRDWGVREFAAGHKEGTIQWDAHGWLEDADGNIYDCVFPWFNTVAKIHSKKKLAIPEGVFEAKSKEELKALGLEYVPAPKDAQTLIFISLLRWMRQSEEDLKSGRAQWVGNMMLMQVR